MGFSDAKISIKSLTTKFFRKKFMKYEKFERIMSQKRMNRYLAACGGDSRKAMTLYRYNLQLSQETFTIISCFEVALRKAKAWLDARPEMHRLITINSWNEWTETSYLQPDDVYGYGYLDAVKKVFL